MTSADPVRLIFLGGVGEAGKNLLLLESDQDVIVVDFGVKFPEEDQYGIDLVLPDIGYLIERRAAIRGIFITHGHEDHIGALPYLLPDLLPAPVFATRLTAGLIRGKLEEAKLMSRVDLRVFDPDEHPVMSAGGFRIEPFRVSHSIPDSVGFCISTPVGDVIVTGDFKFDPTPLDDRPTDTEALARFARRGVRLLVTDCVHVEFPGHTPSERIVGETFDQVFTEAPGRIVIATFASLLSRVQQVIDLAAKHERLVTTLGRSLDNNVRLARELGYLNDPDRVLIDVRDARMLPDDRVVYVVTGSQGEPMAALNRIANGEHRDLAIRDGDTVIVSASPIPGNETAISRVIDKLFALGAEVVYGRRAPVHVSGHASQDELRMMLNLTRPRDVIPTHGEPRHVALYTELAEAAGFDRSRVHSVANGQVVEITPERIQVAGKVRSGAVYVDGSSIGEVGDAIVRDRRTLSRDGMVAVVIALNPRTGRVSGGPDLVSRGFVHAEASDGVLGAASDWLRAEIGADVSGERADEWAALQRRLRDLTARYLFQQTGRRPVVTPLVIETD